MAKERTFSFGGCVVSQISPKIPAEPKIINLKISFPEALKLNLALDECLRKLNRYNMSTEAGKRAAVNLVIHVHVNRIAVAEGKLAK
jgi:hypothetical protein